MGKSAFHKADFFNKNRDGLIYQIGGDNTSCLGNPKLGVKM
jgi:hypothetical protein